MPPAEPEDQDKNAHLEFLGGEGGENAAAEPAEIDLNAVIAERIRTDGQKQARLTPEDALVGLLPGGQHDRISAALAVMGKDPEYKDIKAITTVSGLVFFYSERHFKVTEAAAKGLLEEVKFRIGERVRADSKERQILTPVDALYEEIGWDKGAYGPDEIGKDPLYADIRTVTPATGEVFFYSDRHMSGYYALLLARTAAKDPCAMIAETVRDESRIYPRPTCVLFFLEKLFGVNEADLKTVVEKTLAQPQFDDIKLMIHPSTGGVYLYSNRYLEADNAWSIMDWEEVGRDANP